MKLQTSQRKPSTSNWQEFGHALFLQLAMRIMAVSFGQWNYIQENGFIWKKECV